MRQDRIFAALGLGALMLVSACTNGGQKTMAAIAAPANAPSAPVPMGQQWLYGSAEGAVAARQSYLALTSFALGKAQNRPQDSVVFAPGASLSQPAFIGCDDRPLAVVFDADETLIWNVGAMRWFAENNVAFNAETWDLWEKTGAGKALPMPGAVAAVATLRDAGIAVIANTNRSSANAAGTEATLKAAGLGDFKHGETLFLMGDDDSGSSKDKRRETISERYCVIALAGDQMGDFLQAFNARGLSPLDRKTLANTPGVARLWGAGWFLFANSVYGPSIRGEYDEIFSAETRWQPTIGSEK